MHIAHVTSHDQLAETVQSLGSAIAGNPTRPQGIDLKWKQIEVNEITDDTELTFFIQPVTADCPPEQEKVVIAIEKITIARDFIRIEELPSVDYLSELGRVNEVACLASAYIEGKAMNPEVPFVMTNGVSKIDRTGCRNSDEN